MTCPSVFKDFVNAVDGQLLSSSKIFDNIAAELRSKSDSAKLLLLFLIAERGLITISSVDVWIDTRAGEASSGGTSSVSDVERSFLVRNQGGNK